MNAENEAVILGGGALLLLAALWYAKNHAADIGTAAVTAVGDATAGAVIGAGQMIGIPATNPDKCAEAIANGDYWGASFACPAGTFLKSVF